MKRKLQLLLVSLIAIGISSTMAQTDTTKCCETEINVGLDINSSFIWRGQKFGKGPVFQPKFELTAGSFTLGSWGNINSNYDDNKDNDSEGFEADLYAEYEFPFGVTLGVTDYYKGGNYFGMNFNNMAKTHTIEPSFRYDYSDNLSFFAALNFMEGRTSDFYCELSYDFDLFDLAIGAGEGEYTTSPVWNNGGDFGICNISITKKQKIKITDKYSLPIKGGVTLNPTTERFYVYAGISL